MPEGRYASVVLLAEDQRHIRFMRRWVQEHVNVDSRAITASLPGKGRGAGEQFVRHKFPHELQAHRRQLGRRGALLIAVIDADTEPFEDHYRQLRGQAPGLDTVAVFVPKRNIETWIRALTGGGPVDEITDYKHKTEQDLDKPAALAFLRLIREPEIPAGLLPSLAFGVKEARQIRRDHLAS